MTKAKIIADSISESGIRITTLELEFPRFLLSQFNTHRQFSRSAQSSRAVPVQKMIDAIKNYDSRPKFMKNESGMQSNEPLKSWEFHHASVCWNEAKEKAINAASALLDCNVHKQFANRLLEPFATVKVVVTATEWDNFFALRLHHAAQPEMQELAQAMRDAIDESVPEMIIGSWHLPYVDYDTIDLKGLTDCGDEALELCKLISAARCARVSYLNHDNSTPDIQKDLELAQRLLADKHLSPFEHQARPMNVAHAEYHTFGSNGFIDGATHLDKDLNFWSGNFKSWIQHRQLVDL
jgi:thymidylate synthase ThyX